ILLKSGFHSYKRTCLLLSRSLVPSFRVFKSREAFQQLSAAHSSVENIPPWKYAHLVTSRNQAFFSLGSSFLHLVYWPLLPQYNF
uniref:Uncharacterized protein n=1 Tax=Mandrillus leucophaeus TaxID=9568 RepID=A0A2K5Y728_MANLE